MKQFTALFLLTLGLASCTSARSCSSKTDTVTNPTCDGSSCPAPVPEAATDQMLSGSGWKLQLPVEWAHENIPAEQSKNVELLMSNKGLHEVLLLIKEPFTGTSEDFVLKLIRGLKERGVTINSAKQITLNNNRTVVISTTGTENSVWMWVTIKNGSAYTFSCGGVTSETWHQDSCESIASFLTIE